MNEDNILDVQQSGESSEGGSEVDNTSSEIGEQEIALTPEALEELLTSPSEPIPVTIIEEEEEEYDIVPFAETGTYMGTISDTYLDYFEGIVEKLPFDTHYVVWRSGEYAYSMAFGEELQNVGLRFSGDCQIINIYRDGTNYLSNWLVGREEDIIDLNASELFVYSDLGTFPTLERGVSSLEAEVLLFAVGFSIVFSVCSNLFKYVLERLRS